MSAPATDAPAWAPTSAEPPAADWGAVPPPPRGPDEPAPTPPPPDWLSGPATGSTEWTAPPQEWSPAPVAPPPDWTSAPAPTAPPPFVQESAPSTQVPASFGDPAPAAEPAAPSSYAQSWTTPQQSEPPQPAAADDRLSALTQSQEWTKPSTSHSIPEWTRPSADTWTTTPAQETPAEDPRLAAMNMPAPPQQAAPPPATPAAPSEWAPPPSVGAQAQAKKAGGLFGGLFGRKAAQADAGPSAANGGAASRAGKLAAFSNALLAEYTSGSYGKGKVDDRMPSLLMRVDEQADPIDRPLPVVDDRLDVQALERVNMAEGQAVPYLATLVATIFGDAEKAFGKDKAKRGYKAAQQQIFGGDTSALSGPDLAGKLPKI
jgi:hypothetical protein